MADVPIHADVLFDQRIPEAVIGLAEFLDSDPYEVETRLDMLAGGLLAFQRPLKLLDAYGAFWRDVSLRCRSTRQDQARSRSAEDKSLHLTSFTLEAPGARHAASLLERRSPSRGTVHRRRTPRSST